MLGHPFWSLDCHLSLHFFIELIEGNDSLPFRVDFFRFHPLVYNLSYFFSVEKDF